MKFLCKLLHSDRSPSTVSLLLWGLGSRCAKNVHVFLPVLWRWGHGVWLGDQLSDSKDKRKKRSRHQEVSEGALLRWEPDWIPICNLFCFFPSPNRQGKGGGEKNSPRAFEPIALDVWIYKITLVNLFGICLLRHSKYKERKAFVATPGIYMHLR